MLEELGASVCVEEHRRSLLNFNARTFPHGSPIPPPRDPSEGKDNEGFGTWRGESAVIFFAEK